MENTFRHICQLLVNHGVVPDELHDAEEEWNKHDLPQQREIYRTIRDKIRKGKFVNYHPMLAIRENTPKIPKIQPTNYSGRAIPPNMQVFSAKYDGKWGMYTLQDINRFHMEMYQP